MLQIIVQQSEPFLEGGSENLFLVIGGFALVAILIIVVLLGLLRRRRLRNSPAMEESADLQARLRDVAGRGGSASEPVPTAGAGYSPIEEKLRQAEEAEAEEKTFKRVSLFAEPDAALPETPSGFAESGSSLSDFDVLDTGTSFSFDELLEPEQTFDSDLSYLLGDDEPEPEVVPPPLPNVLDELDVRVFLAQVNKFRLKDQGYITDAAGEISLLWQTGINSHQIRVAVVNDTTIEINGDYFPATEAGLKQGIVMTFKNKNY